MPRPAKTPVRAKRAKAEVEKEFDQLREEAAAARAAAAVKADYDRQIAFLKKDAETGKRLAEMRVKSLEDLVARQAAQIAALEKQHDGAGEEPVAAGLKRQGEPPRPEQRAVR